MEGTMKSLSDPTSQNLQDQTQHHSNISIFFSIQNSTLSTNSPSLELDLHFFFSFAC